MTNGRSVPLLGDISLEYIQRIEHSVGGGFVATPIAGLAGELQQRLGRPSHRITIAGILFGPDSPAQLETLQKAAAAGEELTFAANITTALDLQKVVIAAFRAVELAGQPGRFSYELSLAESPPLPPPAQISSFGGLDEFGVGDLGFDTDLLGDIQDLAGEVAGAVDAALDVIDKLGALANLDGLSLGGFLAPIDDAISAVGDVSTALKDATRGLTEAFG